ncbi:MAG: DNA polymerase III subunit delta [Fibrobacteraceae bacterium]|nr:DNA polymerase III subunit delta [Fibrobacteraceae bacterium]
MILALVGDNEFDKERRIGQFLDKTLGDRKDDPLARKILFATDTNVPSIADAVMEACDSCSLFAGEQTVIVRKCDALHTNDAEALASWILTKPNCQLLLEFTKLTARATKKDEGGNKSSGSLHKALKEAGTIEKYETPREWDIPKWITQHVQTDFGRRIEPMAVSYVADALGTDLAVIDSELKKILLLDPNGKEISLEQVKLMIVPQREIAAFEIREFFGDRNPQAYTKKLRELLDSGVDGIAIISALESYAVRLLHVRAMLDRHTPPKEIASKLGVNEWLFCTKLNEPRKAMNWPQPLLCRVIKHLCKLDSEIKNGICDSRMGLELSLATLVVR